MADDYRPTEAQECRKSYTFHDDLTRLNRCLDAIEDDVWYKENDVEPPHVTSFCDGLPLGYNGICP